jgi:long-chain acyl-CoA synthetase
MEEGLGGLPQQLAQGVARARRAATQWHTRELEGEPIGPLLRGEYALARRLVFEPMRTRLGFDRTHLFVSTTAPLSRELLEFFLSFDVVVREVYGQCETAGVTSLNSPRATQLGRAGRPMLGVEVRIAPDGEVLVRGDNVCLGYHPEAEPGAAPAGDGWLHTGDLGELDEEGYLRITGRRQDLIVSASGRKTAPAALEALLRGISPVSHAVVLGEGRSHLVALLALDPEATRELGQARGWPGEAAALAQHEGFRQYLEAQVDAVVNTRLAPAEALQRFAILPQDLSVEAGELTPTLKVRRAVVAARYKDLVEALYAEPTPARSAG